MLSILRLIGKFPVSAVVGVLAGAATVGSTLALANQRMGNAESRLESQASQITALATETQNARERLIKIEVTTEHTNENVKAVLRKLDRERR